MVEILSNAYTTQIITVFDKGYIRLDEWFGEGWKGSSMFLVQNEGKSIEVTLTDGQDRLTVAKKMAAAKGWEELSMLKKVYLVGNEEFKSEQEAFIYACQHGISGEIKIIFK